MYRSRETRDIFKRILCFVPHRMPIVSFQLMVSSDSVISGGKRSKCHASVATLSCMYLESSFSLHNVP